MTSDRPAPWIRDAVGVPDSGGALAGSGERWLAVVVGNEEFVTNPSRKHVVLFLEPGELGLQITYSPLEAAHLRYHAGIRPANVAE